MNLDQIGLAELPFVAVGDRLAELTKAPDEEPPTRAEAGKFIGEALRFFAMLDARAEAVTGRLPLAAGAALPPLPGWWTPLAVGTYRRRHTVRYLAGDGWKRIWHFRGADPVVWLDLDFNPIGLPLTPAQWPNGRTALLQARGDIAPGA
jgi:hypothetical protein